MLPKTKDTEWLALISNIKMQVFVALFQNDMKKKNTELKELISQINNFLKAHNYAGQTDKTERPGEGSREGKEVQRKGD